MTTPRLIFLYPMLLRPLESPSAAARIFSPQRGVRRTRRFTTGSHQEQGIGTGGGRYGTAQEPAPHLVAGQSSNSNKDTQSDSKASTDISTSQGEHRSGDKTSPESRSLDATESAPSSPAPEPPRMPDQRPLDTVLQMPSPTEDETQKPPHLKTPPYVHHFDTYGLVKDLAKSGFSEEQSVTIMKALRGILTDNMSLARAGLVSKSDVENETYLFRAACSELRTEISNNRKNETEKMRSERNQLQHEVDLLGQRLTQESVSLKDELKGLFDDRKMTVRQEQQVMDSKVCQTSIL
jgi:hypothetical protein